MNIVNNVEFSDYIIDSIRILILINSFKDKKSIKLTDSKIRLYDYYLRFPVTMFEKEITEQKFKANFDEYYSFFHWKPDVIRYRRNLDYLISKGLIVKEFNNNNLYYESTEEGDIFLQRLKSEYKKQLIFLSTLIVKDISKLSETKIEQDIKRKTDICNRVLEV